MLEQIAITIFRLMSTKINGTPQDLEVNPYQMSLKDAGTEIIEDEETNSIKKDVETMWFYN